MKLSEMSSNFERRRVLEYGTGKNTIVRHWYDVCPIVPPYYMGNVRDNNGDTVYDLFLFLPDVKNGVRLNLWIMQDRYDVEWYQKYAQRNGIYDKETFEAFLKNTMEHEGFIGNHMIEFVAQWSPELAKVCSQYRLAYYAKQDEEEQKRSAEQKAKEDAEKAAEDLKKEAEEKAKRAKYLGWADQMTALRFGKVRGCMEKCFRYEGKVLTRRDFVIGSVRDGWNPEKIDGVTHWYKTGWDVKESKPRTEYYLRKGNESYTITKTEYDFANYLVSKVS